jgi:hypothetical protein
MTRGDTFGNNSLSVTLNILSSVIPDLIGDLLFYEGCGFPIDIFGNDRRIHLGMVESVVKMRRKAMMAG